MVFYNATVSNVGRAVKTVLNLAAPGGYETKVIDLFKGEQKSEEYLKVNQMGQVPALSFNGVTLNESNSIIRFLA